MFLRTALALLTVTALAACDTGGGTFNASISGDAAQGFDTGSRTGPHNYRLSGSRYGMR